MYAARLIAMTENSIYLDSNVYEPKNILFDYRGNRILLLTEPEPDVMNNVPVWEYKYMALQINPKNTLSVGDRLISAQDLDVFKSEVFFEESIDYPSDATLRNGLTKGVLFNYVSSSYCNGLLNYLGKPIYVSIFQDYEEFVPTEPEYRYHFNAGNLSDSSIWIFQDGGEFFLAVYDQDVSDCAIGMIRSDVSREEIIALTKKWLEDRKKPYLELDVEKIKGWLSF